MRQVPLTTIKGGIDRLRTKGGARADSLYDLLNGYVTAARTVKVRPGTFREAELPARTKGLCAFDGDLHTFCDVIVTVPAGYVLHVLTHPEATEEEPIEIARIHFAAPFMGALYVVAEFEDGDVYHYWLRSSGAWEANKIYRAGDIVEPTVPNGFAYEATRAGSAYQAWTPRAPREVGDLIEPTTYNDFYYEVTSVAGSTPSAGLTEPDWPTEDGARVTEYAEDTDPVTDAVATAPPSTPSIPPETRERYDR